MSGDEEWFDDFEEQSDASLTDGEPPATPSASTDGGLSDREGEGSPVTSQWQTRPSLYTIIDKPSLQQIQIEALDQVQAILGCSVTVARALLTYFSWDAESVLSTIAERGEEEVYRRAGVLSKSQGEDTGGGAAEQSGSPSQPEGTILCSVCFMDAGPGEWAAMRCGHAFCRDCWQQHLSIGIREGMSRQLRCMAPRCGVLCDEDVVHDVMARSPELLEKFEQALIDGYVDDNRKVKWCPSVPHCGRAVRINSDPHVEVTCHCGQQFCFACNDPPHTPATCEMTREWGLRIRDGTETAAWLNAHTKNCPKCAKPVEKNGGCNLVLCSCGQAFCWLCGQATGRAHDWTTIYGHSCGAYKEKAEAKASDAQRSLERYLHYLTRYEAHLTSLRMEETARMKLDRKIDTMLESDTTSLNHHDWLHTALEQLFLARRVMAYSYVFAFYMFGDMFKDEFTPRQAETNKVLFEDKQGQLEVEVEHLANLVENTPAAKMREERLNIINLASTINLRIMKMYEVIENEIAPQIAGRPLAVAPYRGRRSAADTRAEGTLEEAMGASLVVASEKTSMSELQTSPLNATSPVAKGTRLQKRARQK